MARQHRSRQVIHNNRHPSSQSRSSSVYNLAMASLCCARSATATHSPFPKPSTASVSAPRRATAVTCSHAAADSNDGSQRVSCSRREVLGLGGFLAMGINGLHSLVNPAEADAASATCGEYSVSPSGLAYCDSQVGSGIAATKGMLIKAHYSGKLENGKQFDSSYSRGKPLTFRVGVGEVIRGWDQGILGTEGIPAMQAGGKRTLRIPATLGYGERGAGCRLGSCLIPPNSTLIFDVEFVGKA